jgi:hypothetical protein
LGKKQNDVDGKNEIKAIKPKLNTTSSTMVLQDKCPILNCLKENLIIHQLS